jgi:CHAT domain-containing protein
MERGDDGSLVKLSCRRCGTPSRFSAVRLVEFPVDAGAVLDLVSGRLNVVSCRVCQLRMVLDLTIAAINPEEGTMATVGFSAEDLRATSAQLGDDVELLPQADREALRETVVDWLESYLVTALGPALSGSRPDRNEEGVMPHQEPLVLGWLRRAVAGDLPFNLRTEPPLAPEQQAGLNRALLTDFTVDLVDGLFTHAFHHGGIVTVLDRVEQHVPVECLDPEVLGRLVERCIDFEPELLEDPSRFDRAFHHEYLCAVAHAAAGRSSPRAEHWAALSLLLFSLSRGDAVQVPEMALLESSVLRRLIDFNVAWNAARPLLTQGVERTVDAEAWFDHIGWGERYRQELAAVPFALAVADLEDLEWERLATRLRELAAGQGEDVTDALPGMFATLLLRAGRREDAVRVLLTGLDELAGEGEWARVARTAIEGSSLMSRHLDYGAATELLSRHLDRLLEEDIGCRLHYSVLNEVGNAFRHQGFPLMALETYELVEQLMQDCEAVDEHDRWMLRRNRAIVLRELNSFDEAISELEASLEAVDPVDLDERIGLLVSLARTYVDASLPEHALPYAEEAARIPLAFNRAPQRIEVLLALAAARAAASSGAEIPQLTEAMELAEQLPRLRAVVAAATLHHARSCVLESQTVARARAALEDIWQSPDPSFPPMLLMTAAYCLAEWELEQGNHDRAGEIVASLRERFGTSLSWMVDYLEARLPSTEIEDAWALMKSVLQALDGSVPDQAGVGFAAPFLVANDEVHGFLLLTLRSALDAGVAGPADCVAVFELLNGREMRGALAAADRPDPLERLESVAGQLPVLFLPALEYEDEIQVVLVRPGGECRLIPLGIDAPAVRRISTEFAARAVTCLITPQMEALEALVEPVLDALGAVIESEAAAGEHVCVLPSPSLLGLPLHAARFADGTLALERHGISVAPNLSVVCRVLEGGERVRTEDQALVAAVCKQGDREELVHRVEAAAEHVEAALVETRITSLRDLGAEKQAVLAGIEGCDHFVFIGHGARAPHAHGRGLCVAADGELPNAPLPVDVVPELRRFMIDAGDLETLARTPALVSSIACSSGRSLAGDGGTRLGLERALFAGGTRTILAPQWDVNGPSALRFLEAFYDNLCGDGAAGVAEAYRRACLLLKEEGDHLFLWAPFELNGSWI